MTLDLVALAYDATDPARVAGFWAGLLGREPLAEEDSILLPGTSTQVGLRFVPSRAARSGRDRMHLHLTSRSAGDQQATVARALELGGRHLDVGQGPDAPFVVLADPEGNELCVIEPGNAFLAGTGRLGEVSCDGTRAVGVFWSRSLGWPLVWDQDEETAIQSPAGGTKISWGGPPVAERTGPNRQRFELAATDGELDRLLTLGATRHGDALLDPDGNEFVLRPA